MALHEREIDIAVASEQFPWVMGTYLLQPSELALAHPDCLLYAIVLSPFGINELVETHYGLLEATDARDAVGRVLYVDALNHPTPMGHAKRINVPAGAREASIKRILERRARAAAERRGAKSLRHRDLHEALDRLAEQRGEPAPGEVTAPYRTRAPNAGLISERARAELRQQLEALIGNAAIAISLSKIVVEIVKDPFPSPPKPRVLVIDDDETTAARLRANGFEVTEVDDGWRAIDLAQEKDFDVVVCAVVVGDFTGAKLHRLIAKAKPELASRIVLLASANTVANAPPSSASGRVLARPIDPAALKAIPKRS